MIWIAVPCQSVLIFDLHDGHDPLLFMKREMMVPLPMVNVDYRREKCAQVQMWNRPRLSSVLILLPLVSPWCAQSRVTCRLHKLARASSLICAVCCTIWLSLAFIALSDWKRGQNSKDSIKPKLEFYQSAPKESVIYWAYINVSRGLWMVPWPEWRTDTATVRSCQWE